MDPMTVSLCFYSINCMIVVHCCHRGLLVVVVVVSSGLPTLAGLGSLGSNANHDADRDNRIEQRREKKKRTRYGEEECQVKSKEETGSRGNEIILSWGNSGPRIETEVKSSTPVYALGYIRASVTGVYGYVWYV